MFPVQLTLKSLCRFYCNGCALQQIVFNSNLNQLFFSIHFERHSHNAINPSLKFILFLDT